MVKIDFYGLENGSIDMFVCRLCAKAWQQQHRIYIQVDSADYGNKLDELLWTYNDRSFLPHAYLTDNAAPDAKTPIYIGRTPAPKNLRDVLINLSGQIPENCTEFSRIVEIIAADAAAKQSGRERYRYYQQQNFALEYHTIK